MKQSQGEKVTFVLCNTTGTVAIFRGPDASVEAQTWCEVHTRGRGHRCHVAYGTFLTIERRERPSAEDLRGFDRVVKLLNIPISGNHRTQIRKLTDVAHTTAPPHFLLHKVVPF